MNTIADHATLVASARNYRLTNSTSGRYGQGFVNGYVARCLREAARVRKQMVVREAAEERESE